ncbi:MAG TPA: DUF4258 domain-containing protein [Candidatus Lokiarchaeia archaeon]|nr:DUF4258 domain-containing protein [Candidatus Lokiarchaeia archaeon]
MRDIQTLPVRFTKHAALRLLERFGLSLEEVKHFIKTANIVKPVEKDGNPGILQGRIGQSKIRFVFTIRQDILWIITVEECI